MRVTDYGTLGTRENSWLESLPFSGPPSSGAGILSFVPSGIGLISGVNLRTSGQWPRLLTMKRTSLPLTIALLSLWIPLRAATPSARPLYLDETHPITERVENALSLMTLEEKVALLHAQSKFSSRGVPRLGIPELWMSDGPHGIRAEVLWNEWNEAHWTNDACTGFPALTCLAATWNPELAHLFGKSIGQEARYREKDVLLGPGVNIYRTPLNGRNFEYMGEDPYLSATMVVPYVEGVQENGVAACVKHFVLNNQETRRGSINVVVSDRALHEIYLPAFKAAVVRGHVWSIMGSYNRYLGTHCSHNDVLLNRILKRDWGFDGAAISDWGAVHDTIEAADNGLDLEMGTRVPEGGSYDDYFLGKSFREALESGRVRMEDLNDKARRVLTLIFRTAMNRNKPWGSFVSEAHSEAARRIGDEGIVLLQNRGDLLPLDPSRIRTIAVVGENATRSMTVGGGSSSLKVKYEISPLQGLRSKWGDRVDIRYAQGYSHDEENGVDLVTPAVEAARNADLVLFIGGLSKDRFEDAEGSDRKDYGLPFGQDVLIDALAAVNSKTVVVLISGNAVETPWVDRVPAIVQAWYLGSEAGNAIADVLTGDVNPSGKLPFTFPKKLSDSPAHSVGEYPGDEENVEYKEGLLIGYRWFDTRQIEPQFCFGHGLSYTSFAYGEPTLDRTTLSGSRKIQVRVPVRNTGSRAGAEIVQLYISDPECSVERPAKELKGFQKIRLEPGQEKLVTFEIGREALAFYDETSKTWKAESGRFRALIGASSRDIRRTIEFRLE